MSVGDFGDLDWRAFCYVAGELSDDEAASFEQCLETDQQAREAVAQAVKLTQAVASVVAEPESIQPLGSASSGADVPRSGWAVRAGWAVDISWDPESRRPNN